MMRSRSSHEIGEQVSWSRLNQPVYAGTCTNPWNISTTYSYSGVVTLWEEWVTMEDFVTPDYHRRIRQGQIINNPMSKQTVIQQNSVGTMDWDLIQYTLSCTPQKQIYTGSRDHGAIDSLTWNGGWTNLMTTPALDVQDVIDIANTSAWSKQQVNEAMVLASLGELKETISSIISILGRAIGILKALKRWQVKVLLKEISPKELANRYMEARYAIRPLVYDVTQIIAAFNASKAGKRMTTRGYAAETSSSVRTGWQGWNSAYATVKLSQSVQRSVSARSGVMAAVKKISNLQIWGADQILGSAWELVPLSFVVDWFFNVGKTIAALSPTRNLQHLASWCVVEDTVLQTSMVSESIPLWPTTRIYEKNFIATGGISRTTITKYRLVNPQVSVLPSFTVNLDAWKILDLAIILKNILK